jgi:hypothetical protein
VLEASHLLKRDVTGGFTVPFHVLPVETLEDRIKALERSAFARIDLRKALQLPLEQV